MVTASLTIGNRGVWPFHFPYRLNEERLRTHIKIMGLSGMGKSCFIANAAADLHKQDLPFSLIDPHTDLAHDTLRLIYESGYFHRPGAYKKLWYVDFARPDRFVPFNVLKQTSYPLSTIARNVQEAFFRAFPALAGGVAPVFQNVLQYTVIALAQNGHPITHAGKLLSPGNTTFRQHLLANVTHQPTIDFFHDRFAYWKDQADKVESTLNKVDLFSFTDHMRYALCQLDTLLDFRRIIDEGISVIYNLGGAAIDEDTQKLLGCLLTVGYEQAALARGDLPPERRQPYFLIIDEFGSFVRASGETYAKILSQARKFHFYLWLAHQTLGQVPVGLQTAVQNTGMEVNFGLGATDALEVARHIIHYADEIKHEVKDPTQIERTHPMFYSIQEQERQLADRLRNQWPREAIVTVRVHPHPILSRFQWPYKTIKVRTLTVPKQTCDDEDIQAIKEYYAKKLLRSKTEIEAASVQQRPCPLPAADAAGDETEQPTSRWEDV